jgi:hypothetical protein
MGAPNVIDTGEAARILGVSHKKVYRLVQAGELNPVPRVFPPGSNGAGYKKYFLRVDVHALARRRPVPGLDPVEGPPPSLPEVSPGLDPAVVLPAQGDRLPPMMGRSSDPGEEEDDREEEEFRLPLGDVLFMVQREELAEARRAVERHRVGDWCEEQRERNLFAAELGHPVTASFLTERGVIYCETRADRSETEVFVRRV